MERRGATWTAGYQAQDELIALDGWQLRDSKDLDARVMPGKDQELLICRRGQLHCLPLRSVGSATDRWTVEVDTSAPEAGHQARRDWFQLLP